jgi:hypothetical protein
MRLEYRRTSSVATLAVFATGAAMTVTARKSIVVAAIVG